MTARRTRIAVIVCSVGRPDCVQALAPLLAAQTRKADRVLFVVSSMADVGADVSVHFDPDTKVEVVVSPKGLPMQRNRGLDAVQQGTADDADLVLFIDDDFVPSIYALDGVEQVFAAFPDVNGITGHLVADGINDVGFSHEAACQLVSDFDAKHGPISDSRPLEVLRDGLLGLYGCNMAFRLSAVGSIRFDERLPLYGWQEDIDFAARVPGRLIKTNAISGVHRGAKSGRETAGRRLGYSQIANPWYLWRKGTMSAKFASRLVLRNFLANHIKALRPEPWIDRAGRAGGNWLALWDIVTGRADPGRIVQL